MSQFDNIKGIGPKMKEKLHRNSIYDCFDMINKFPSRYDIFQLTSLKDVIDNQRATLEGKVSSVAVVSYIRKNFTRLSFKVVIEDREFKVSIFNREFLKNKLEIGTDIVITGTIDRLVNTFSAATLKLKKNFKNEIFHLYLKMNDNKYLLLILNFQLVSAANIKINDIIHHKASYITFY